jgi:hypothetical protein
MKVEQFGKVLKAAEELFRDNGNVTAAQSLRELSTLFAGRETMTVSSFCAMLAKTAGDGESSGRH